MVHNLSSGGANAAGHPKSITYRNKAQVNQGKDPQNLRFTWLERIRDLKKRQKHFSWNSFFKGFFYQA